VERIYTNEGIIRDIEKNVVELCREAFNEHSDFKWESDYRPSHDDFEDMDIINAKITDLPVVYAWVDSEIDDGNETGGIQRKPSKYHKVRSQSNRNKATYIVVVCYATHWDLPKEGHKKVRAIADMLKRKLVENSNLLGIANMGGRLKELNFDPDLIMKDDGSLSPTSMVKIVMEYDLVERQTRAQ